MIFNHFIIPINLDYHNTNTNRCNTLQASSFKLQSSNIMEEIIISRMTCEKRFEAGAWRDSIENMVIPQYRLAGFKKITFDTDFFEQDVTFDITMNLNPLQDGHIHHGADDSITLVARVQSPSASVIDLKLKMKKNVEDMIRNRTHDMELLKQDAQKLFQKCCKPDHLDNNDGLDDNVDEMQRNIGLIAEQIKNHQREIDLIKQDIIEIKNVDTISEYTIVLCRDRISHINGLPGQKKPFSLCWFTERAKNKQMVPTSIISVDRSIIVTYSDLEKL